MTVNDIKDLIKARDGKTLLEYCGNLFEYVGESKQNRMIFQDVNGVDVHITFSREELLKDKTGRYQIWRKWE